MKAEEFAKNIEYGFLAMNKDCSWRLFHNMPALDKEKGDWETLADYFVLQGIDKSDKDWEQSLVWCG